MKKIIDFIKDSKYQLIFGIAFVIFGLIILLLPGTTLKTICFILGIGVAIKGFASIIDYVKAKNNGEEKLFTLISGILTLLCAFILIWHPQRILSIIPVIIGIGVLVYGISSVLSKKGGLISKIFSVITITIGVAIITSPFKLAEAATSIMGLALVVVGVLIIVTEIPFTKKTEFPEDNDGYKEVEFKDVDE